MDKILLTSQKIENSEVEGSLVKISGYCCHFNRANCNGEIVDKDSFVKFFETLHSNGMMPAMNFNHIPTQVIGGWDKIEAKDEGLWVEGHINTDVAFSRDTVIPLLNSGDLQGLSTEGFTEWCDVEEREDGWYLKNFNMLAIAVCSSIPADMQAKFSVNSIAAEHKETLKTRKDTLTLASMI